MSFRRRPISKGNYRWQRGPKPESSLRYELICSGSVRLYKDGREVCQDSPGGYREYNRRIETMLERQEWKCCLCGEKIRSRTDATFEHQRRRGMGSAFRNDAVANSEGQPINGAAHWQCNVERG